MIFKGGVGAVLSPSHMKKPVTLFSVRRYHTKGILRKIKSCKTALMIWLSKIIPFLRHWALGSIIICGCSQRTAKRMVQQHTGDNIPIGVHRTVSDRLRYPLLSYQLFQRIHLLFQKVKRYLWIDFLMEIRIV